MYVQFYDDKFESITEMYKIQLQNLVRLEVEKMRKCKAVEKNNRTAIKMKNCLKKSLTSNFFQIIKEEIIGAYTIIV